jgi:hypothetical protein
MSCALPDRLARGRPSRVCWSLPSITHVPVHIHGAGDDALFVKGSATHLRTLDNGRASVATVRLDRATLQRPRCVGSMRRALVASVSTLRPCQSLRFVGARPETGHQCCHEASDAPTRHNSLLASQNCILVTDTEWRLCRPRLFQREPALMPADPPRGTLTQRQPGSRSKRVSQGKYWLVKSAVTAHRPLMIGLKPAIVGSALCRRHGCSRI